jgi:hypothetical protein
MVTCTIRTTATVTITVRWRSFETEILAHGCTGAASIRGAGAASDIGKTDFRPLAGTLNRRQMGLRRSELLCATQASQISV